MLLIIFILGSISAFFTSITVGANDVANSFATSVGANVLKLKSALIIAAVFEFLGAFLMGSHVTDTIRKGIVNVEEFHNDSESLALGMLCASFATGIWLAFATFFNAPVSTTHSTVGSIVGFSLVYSGFNAIVWEKIVLIVLSWFISPLLSGILTNLFFSIIKYYSLQDSQAIKKALQILPFMVFLTISINCFFIIYKGTPALGLKNLKLVNGIGYSCIAGLICGLFTYFLIKFYLIKKIDEWIVNEFRKQSQQICIYDEKAEKLFSYLQIFTACMSAFAHGANDVANSIGPYATIFNIYENGTFSEKSFVPIWILAAGGAGIVVGLGLFGKRLINKVGKDLSEITPSRGFTMELGASLSVVTASRIGIPVSTTHCQIGSIVGGGLADGKKNVDWKLFRKIIFAWFITLPITAGISATLFYISS